MSILYHSLIYIACKPGDLWTVKRLEMTSKVTNIPLTTKRTMACRWSFKRHPFCRTTVRKPFPTIENVQSWPIEPALTGVLADVGIVMWQWMEKRVHEINERSYSNEASGALGQLHSLLWKVNIWMKGGWTIGKGGEWAVLIYKIMFKLVKLWF